MLQAPQGLPDHHVHTRYSRCCHEEYDLRDVVSQLRARGAPYYCVSDHIHWNKDDAYFPQHEAAAQVLVEQHLLDRPLFLGAEVTIVDLEGHLAAPDHARGKLSYILAGDHYIPGTYITMDDLPGSRAQLQAMARNGGAGVTELLAQIKHMYVQCITTARPNVLVHPYSTLLRCEFAPAAALSDFEAVCDAAQQAGTAIEINCAQIDECVDHPAPPLCPPPDCLPLPDFYDQLMRVLRRYDIPYALASDAHQLEKVGDVRRALEIVAKFTLSHKKRLDFLQSEHLIRPFAL